MESYKDGSRALNVIRHLLLIDDDPLTEVLLEGISGNLHLINRYVFKGGGKQGLDYLSFCKKINDFPDVIILDLMMPEMDGFEFLEKFDELFREEAAKTNLIIASSSNISLLEDTVKKYSNIKMFIQKPIVKDRFIEIYKFLFQ